MIKEPLSTLYGGGAIFYFNKDSNYVIFSCNKIGIISIDLNYINLDGTKYEEGDPETIVHIRLFTGPGLKYSKIFKKLNKKWVLVMRHPLSFCNWCLRQDDKKKIEQIFTHECFPWVLVVYNMGVLDCSGSEGFAWKLDIIQRMRLCDFMFDFFGQIALIVILSYFSYLMDSCLHRSVG